MCWEFPGGRQGRGNERVVPLRQQAGSVMGISNWHVAHKQRMRAREKGESPRCLGKHSQVLPKSERNE